MCRAIYRLTTYGFRRDNIIIVSPRLLSFTIEALCIFRKINKKNICMHLYFLRSPQALRVRRILKYLATSLQYHLPITIVSIRNILYHVQLYHKVQLGVFHLTVNFFSPTHTIIYYKVAKLWPEFYRKTNIFIIIILFN